MRSILASYALHPVSNKAATSMLVTEVQTRSARSPFSALQRTDSGIDMEPEDTPEMIAGRQSRISGVIHFAAYKSVEESIRMPLRYYSNNVCGLVDFLSLLEEFGIKNFVFSSSATVYGEGANCGVPLREELCVHHPESFHDEDGLERHVLPGVMGLTSPYGRSKFMCESILADIARSDPSWSITALRYFNPVGNPSLEATSMANQGFIGGVPRIRTSRRRSPTETKQPHPRNCHGPDWYEAGSGHFRHRLEHP